MKKLLFVLALAAALNPSTKRLTQHKKWLAGVLVVSWTLGPALASQEMPSATDLVADVIIGVEREFLGGLGEGWTEAKIRARTLAIDRPDYGVEIANELLKATHDPFTRLVLRDEARRLITSATGGQRSNVGVVFSGAEPVAARVLAGSSAERGGLKAGDRILSVDATTVDTAEEAAYLLSNGEPGTVVSVVLADHRGTRRLTRGTPVPSVMRLGNTLRIRDISRTTASALRSAMDEKTAIIDLRHNSGGALDGAAEAAELFLKRGQTVVTIFDKQSGRRRQIAPENGPFAFTPKPLYILVDRNTASAAELFAGTLSDNHRAILVAPPPGATYGKAKIQRAVALPDGNLLLVTRAMYQLPTSNNIDGHGLRADRIGPQSSCSIDSVHDDPVQCVADSIPAEYTLD